MIPLSIPNTSGNEARYLLECIETNFVSTIGPFVTKFEEEVCSNAGAKFGVSTCSGTAGLHLALTSVGVGRDDLVILPSFTFVASANAVSHCGAQPWFFDVSEDSWTLDVDQIRECLENETYVKGNVTTHKETGRRVAAIMPVYTLGHTADMYRLKTLADEFNLPVVADAAAAIGSKYYNKNIGNLADLTVFSFNGNKTITCGGGGMVIGNDEELLSYARHISTTARQGNDYTHDQVGFNYRLTNLQAAVGCAQIERLDEFVLRKREIDSDYRKQFSDQEGIGFFPSAYWSESSCWFSGITILDQKLPNVSELCELLRSRGVAARTFWKPIHLQLPYKSAPKTSLRISENIFPTILTLPCSTQLSKEEQSNVVLVVKDLIG